MRENLTKTAMLYYRFEPEPTETKTEKQKLQISVFHHQNEQIHRQNNSINFNSNSNSCAREKHQNKQKSNLKIMKQCIKQREIELLMAYQINRLVLNLLETDGLVAPHLRYDRDKRRTKTLQTSPKTLTKTLTEQKRRRR